MKNSSLISVAAATILLSSSLYAVSATSQTGVSSQVAPVVCGDDNCSKGSNCSNGSKGSNCSNGSNGSKGSNCSNGSNHSNGSNDSNGSKSSKSSNDTHDDDKDNPVSKNDH